MLRPALRQRFASFATQTYLSIACYNYGDFAEDSSAVMMATNCVRKLIALQVYSVHQYGMAPALLECA
jgi:hypothetical protein